MKRLIVVLLVLFGIHSLTSQTIVIIGKQKILSKTKKPELTCTPVKITKTMKITKVSGKCKGFWIQRGSITTHKYMNKEDAVGIKLKPGIYYVYPYLKENSEEAGIKVTIVASNSS